MILQRFEVPGLAHYSYLIASEREAAVIDPQRDTSAYLQFARVKGLAIRYVLETHIHADYVSGAAALAEFTGAKLALSAYDTSEQFKYKMPHTSLWDGDELAFGNLRIVAVHTPGHTPEHLRFLLYERQGCGHPLGLFSGDFLLIGSLGRPDLLGEEAKQSLAVKLFESVNERIAKLPDGTIVYPAHGAGSLCGVGISERPESTLGYERSCNIFMVNHSRDEFIAQILASVPQFPEYYKRMKGLNAEGAVSLPAHSGDQAVDTSSFGKDTADMGVVVLDVRSPEAFGGAHIPGALNIGAGPNLSLWAGWVLPYDADILLVGDSLSNLEEVRWSLARVGHDRIAGVLQGGFSSWVAAGLQQAHLPQMSVLELNEAAFAGGVVLDVRSPAEWKSGHIVSAIHIPLGDLLKRLEELPKSQRIHVICGSGYRSSIACSLLQRAEFTDIRNTLGGMAAWYAQSLQVVK